MNRDETSERPRGFSNDFLILIAVLLFAVFVFPTLFEKINRIVEHKRIYKDSLQQIDKAGGWQAIESASLAFATDIKGKPYFSEQYYWRGKRLTTNELSATLEALQPWRIELEPDENHVPLLRIILYGIHRTGAYDQPYFGIWVVCTNVPADYVPKFTGDRAGRSGEIERKGNLIFEAR